MKLALGTAQFGMHYGVTNTVGRPSEHTVKNILSRALKANISVLDTASAYGESEAVLGHLIKNKSCFNIVTKVPPLGLNENNELTLKERLEASIQASFEYLGVERIYGILLHDVMDLLGPYGQEVYEKLLLLRNEGKIQKIGVSVYSPQTIEEVLEKYAVDLVQLPLNILDQRAVQLNMLSYLRQNNIEVHTRSAFLQGILLSSVDMLPTSMNKISHQLALFEQLSEETGYSKMALAFDFLKRQSEIDHVIVGVVNEFQLMECIAAFNENIAYEINYDVFKCLDLSIIDPRNWCGI